MTQEYTIIRDDKTALDATIQVDTEGLTFLSRGGSKKRGTQVNFDYLPALQELLKRLSNSELSIEYIYVDSKTTKNIPLFDKLVLLGDELNDPDAAYFKMHNRIKLVGQDQGVKGGNSTKKLRIVLQDPRKITETIKILQLSEKEK